MHINSVQERNLTLNLFESSNSLARFYTTPDKCKKYEFVSKTDLSWTEIL